MKSFAGLVLLLSFSNLAFGGWYVVTQYSDACSTPTGFTIIQTSSCGNTYECEGSLDRYNSAKCDEDPFAKPFPDGWVVFTQWESSNGTCAGTADTIYVFPPNTCTQFVDSANIMLTTDCGPSDSISYGLYAEADTNCTQSPTSSFAASAPNSCETMEDPDKAFDGKAYCNIVVPGAQQPATQPATAPATSVTPSTSQSPVKQTSQSPSIRFGFVTFTSLLIEWALLIAM